MEAKELRITVVLRGNGDLASEDSRRVLARSIDEVGHDLGASTVAVSFPAVPGLADPAQIRETETDWIVE